MSEVDRQITLTEVAKRSWTIDQFDEYVSSVLIDEDKELFGDLAVIKIRDSLLALGTFAPEPATFSKDAYAQIAAVDESTGEQFDLKETERAIEIAEKIGAMRKNDQDRFLVSVKANEILESLLGKV